MRKACAWARRIVRAALAPPPELAEAVARLEAASARLEAAADRLAAATVRLEVAAEFAESLEAR
jgi:hypothetical protein